jgi:hypothetical protein
MCVETVGKEMIAWCSVKMILYRSNFRNDQARAFGSSLFEFRSKWICENVTKDDVRMKA